MSGFEPIAGTLGAIAFADQLFSRCMWIYGKYKISEAFGASFVEYSIQYETEVWRFESIRDHTMFELSDDPVDNNGRALKSSLRTRLLQWAHALQACEDLIVACEGKPADEEGAEEGGGPNFNAGGSGLFVQGLEPAPLTVSTTPLGTPASSTVPATPSTAATPAPTTKASVSEAETKPAEVEPTATAASVEPIARKPTKRKLLRPRDWIKSFQKQKEKDEKSHKTPVLRAAEIPKAVTDPALRVEDVDTSILSDRAKGIQDQTSVVQRASWVMKRDDFLELLEQLKGHGDFFTSAIQIDQSRRSAAALMKAKRLKPLLERYRSIGDRLRKLVESLANVHGIQQTSVEFMLHDDPFQLQTKLSTASGHDQFRPESAAFYTRLDNQALASSQSAAGSDEATSGPPQPNTQDKYLVFDVPAEARAIASTGTGSRIKNVQLLVNPTPETTCVSGWAGFLGHMDEAIHVFSDLTTHSTEKSLAHCLADDAEQLVLRQYSHANFRARLGLIVASSLFYRVQAQGPRDIEARHLRYYPALDEDGNELERRKTRINPFAPLRMAGTAASTSSSAAALSADGGDAVETITVKKLGILLYEIGAWELVSGMSFAERVRSVKVRKERLAIISPIYSDVVRVCLNCKVEGKMVDWMFENVVEPLKRVVDKYDKIELLH